MIRKTGVYRATTFQTSGHHHSVQVGDDFSSQYYNTLCHCPQNTYKFYKDESILSRPGDNGMRSVTTIKEIGNEIMHSEIMNTTVILLAMHAQDTVANSIIVGVTGLLSKDGMSKCFTQTFVLASQPEGFYVKNDFLRYIDMIHHAPNGIEYFVVSMEDNDTFKKEDVDALNQVNGSTVVPSLAYEQVTENNSSTVVPATGESTESLAAIEARIARMILVKNVPPHVTRKLLSLALKDFGPIRRRNINFRGYDDGYRYAFVEFNNPRAATLAVEAGSIDFDGWESLIESKKLQIED